ncbi:MAG: hypothetical protein E7004_03640 [Alphaproteobacteria bacterium]|nr:hypothetical protein [Alphaproteobacteria bacterium]
MNKIDINNLTGKCLVATPNSDGEFAQSVIYICSHGKDGAMGFIINHRLKEFSFSDLAVELPFPFKDKSLPISLYQGGPLDKTKGFILHSDEYQIADSINISSGISVSSSLEVLQDIACGKGPKQRIIALGYAGWAPEQLEKEILNNQWVVVDANQDLVLGDKDSIKWEQALSSLGINNLNFSDSLGHS